jgi:hypothetical protein
MIKSAKDMSYSMKWYETNKRTLSKRQKDARLSHREILLESINFPPCLAPWVKIGSVNVVLQLGNWRELYDLIQIRAKIWEQLLDCRADAKPYVPPPDFNKMRVNLVAIDMGRSVLKRKQKLLKAMDFPEEIAYWSKINPTCVTIFFNSYEDVERFMCISDLLADRLETIRARVDGKACQELKDQILEEHKLE